MFHRSLEGEGEQEDMSLLGSELPQPFVGSAIPAGFILLVADGRVTQGEEEASCSYLAPRAALRQLCEFAREVFDEVDELPASETDMRTLKVHCTAASPSIVQLLAAWVLRHAAIPCSPLPYPVRKAERIEDLIEDPWDAKLMQTCWNPAMGAKPPVASGTPSSSSVARVHALARVAGYLGAEGLLRLATSYISFHIRDVCYFSADPEIAVSKWFGKQRDRIADGDLQESVTWLQGAAHDLGDAESRLVVEAASSAAPLAAAASPSL
jgi:hypothetical protein